MQNHPKFCLVAVLFAACYAVALVPSTALAKEKMGERVSSRSPVAQENSPPTSDSTAGGEGDGGKAAVDEEIAESVTEEAVDVASEVVPGTDDAATQSAADKKNEESSDGNYEYKRSYGIGFEVGHWFNDLQRIGDYVFKYNGRDIPARNLDGRGQWHFDLDVETSFLEGTRLTLFGGVEASFPEKPEIHPSSLAIYVGLEPAFAFRRGMWEAAIGIGIGYGSLMMRENDKKGKEGWNNYTNNMYLLRPFFEVRHYFTDYMALYGRIGFNQWLFGKYSFGKGEKIMPKQKDGHPLGDAGNLNEGGPYLAIGMRFGYYPTQESVIGDRDGDGYKDDVDKCPDDPEDFDNFEDEDGCPDLDNDKDGILDVDDQCPNDAEDKDGFEDEDGCPDPDNDKDTILDIKDKCPNEAEDFDGFEDEDGCPDPDNDKDGILDVKDQCPNDPEDFDGLGDEDGCPEDDFDNDGILDTEDKCPKVPGVPQKQGCPFEKVQITLDQIVILDKVFFNFNKAVIKRTSYSLLNDVADTIKAYPRIKKIEVAGHTDHAGSEKYNERLSQQRADAVMKYLVDRGVEQERLVAKGYGESSPLVPLPEDGKETKEGAEKNRRVEFNIIEQEKVTKTIREDEAERVKEEDRKRKLREAAKEKADAEKKAADEKAAAEAAQPTAATGAATDAKPDAEKDATK